MFAPTRTVSAGPTGTPVVASEEQENCQNEHASVAAANQSLFWMIFVLMRYARSSRMASESVLDPLLQPDGPILRRCAFRQAHIAVGNAMERRVLIPFSSPVFQQRPNQHQSPITRHVKARHHRVSLLQDTCSTSSTAPTPRRAVLDGSLVAPSVEFREALEKTRERPPRHPARAGTHDAVVSLKVTGRRISAGDDSRR